MVIFSAPSGRKIEYAPPRRGHGEVGVLTIDEAAPVSHLTWYISRGVLIRIGVRCVLAALKR